ncbi:hypothetical protein [Telmatospirillum siberiense]|uniref:Uncharacterized protein n=1 Tax=Telmatospirillum siberiense TaxID=382514 RepID=A0A2N3PY39_9PROT|nr:hypothetical protein [Telmatospirillum siberiense]PKU25309.1 hypothetical protein CWS72_06845 [Telmatospirillum siberiense]
MVSEEGRQVQEELEPSEYAPNVLVVMARGSDGGLWRAAGGAVSTAELNLPADLADRLGQWSRSFTEATRDEADPHRTLVLTAFSTVGLDIARAVQVALGDGYEILFFDEAKLEADAYLTEYLYPARTED